MEVIIDYSLSVVKINWLFDCIIEIHLTKINALKKRLEEQNEFPFKRIFWISTPLDTFHIWKLWSKKKNELLQKLNNIPKVK